MQLFKWQISLLYAQDNDKHSALAMVCPSYSDRKPFECCILCHESHKTGLFILTILSQYTSYRCRGLHCLLNQVILQKHQCHSISHFLAPCTIAKRWSATKILHHTKIRRIIHLSFSYAGIRTDRYCAVEEVSVGVQPNTKMGLQVTGLEDFVPRFPSFV
jgi:hypothetical protein